MICSRKYKDANSNSARRIFVTIKSIELQNLESNVNRKKVAMQQVALNIAIHKLFIYDSALTNKILNY